MSNLTAGSHAHGISVADRDAALALALQPTAGWWAVAPWVVESGVPQLVSEIPPAVAESPSLQPRTGSVPEVAAQPPVK